MKKQITEFSNILQDVDFSKLSSVPAYVRRGVQIIETGSKISVRKPAEMQTR